MIEESPNGNIVLQADGLGVSFRVRTGLFRKQTLRAVDHVDLRLRRGRVVGLVGESGCGKSTVARALIGLQAPTQGRILLEGVDVWSMPQRHRRRHVARQATMVFQDPTSSLNPRMDVAGLVGDPLHVHKAGTAAERRARVADLVDLVHLPQTILRRRTSELSGGQRQRVAIARALALRPAVLIADEPTSALDVSVRVQILDLFAELRDTLQLAMLFVSHDIHTVRHLSDAIAVMYLGRVVEEGPAALVAQSPRHPYTHALFSAAPSLSKVAHGRVVLDGAVPSLRNPPSGCPFIERCWRSSDECSTRFPQMAMMPSGQRYHCIHPLGADDRRVLGSAAGEAPAGSRRP